MELVRQEIEQNELELEILESSRLIHQDELNLIRRAYKKKLAEAINARKNLKKAIEDATNKNSTSQQH